MKLGKGGGSVDSAPSITPEIAAITPSLVGYWKCSDLANGVIPDHSGNGYDLTMTCADAGNNIGDAVCGLQSDGIFIDAFGFLNMTQGWTALTSVLGTKLDTGSKFAIIVAELRYDGGITTDSDFGTGWMGTPNETSDADIFTGIQLQTVFNGIGTRVLWDDEGSSTNVTTGTSLPTDNVGTLACIFKPSIELYSSIVTRDESNIITSEVAESQTKAGFPAALVAQNGSFGLRATHTRSMPIKNYQIWAFDSEPLYADETIRWMAKNPNKIPPWWIGT